MKPQLRVVLGWIFLAGAFPCLAAQAPSTPSAQPNPAASRAWTVDEALAQLHLYPKDAYLQYVALQLARRNNRLDEVTLAIDRLHTDDAREERQGRASQVDLF